MHQAIVLIGPTGSGKTPLGELLSDGGIWGRRCVHFDFGTALRQIASGDSPGDFSDTEVQFVANVLATGALLEDSDFHIALRAIRGALAAQNADEHCLVVLNGLPRHVGQARDLQEVVDVRGVVVLNCSPAVVGSRIATNSGGDRTGRRDDDIGAVRRRLDIFAERTLPLVDYYRSRGATIHTIEITETTTPREITAELDQRCPLQ
jgi:adenylate kinase